MTSRKKNFAAETLKKVILGSFATLGCTAVLYNVKAAVAATATMPIMVNLIRAIEMSIEASLTFGTLAMTAEQGGAAQLKPSNNSLVIDSGGSLALAGGTPQAGRVNIKGASLPVAISVENSTVQLSNGFAFVTIKDFNILTDNAGQNVNYTPTINNPSFVVPIGGTLVTKPQQPTGTYVGRTKIFVNFQ